MSLKIIKGIFAGIVAGVVFGMMMQMMSAPAPDGKEMPMMAMVAMVVGSTSMVVGWLYHLLNSAVIGAIFGGLLGGRAESFIRGLGWGAVYGLVWWMVGSLVLMPIMLGMAPFAPLMMPAMRMVAMGSLMGHVIFGVILGISFFLLRRRTAEVPQPAS